jgi:hypothetical protein
MAQHSLIRKCLEEGGEMHRTAHWVEPMAKKPTPVKEQDYEYQPFSRMVHNKEMQITGSIDKMSIEERNKTKTRGTTDQVLARDRRPPKGCQVGVFQASHGVGRFCRREAAGLRLAVYTRCNVEC